jgi:hypothetical protein
MTTVAATRPSTLASVLDDKNGLMPYVAATTLRTVAQHPDLMARLALIHGDDWKAYRPLYEEAEQRGGGREASAGTNVHMVVQAHHAGADVSAVPEPARSDGLAVIDAIDAMGFDIVGCEEFVVTEGLPELCAGTTDLLLQHRRTGQVVVGDTKSVGDITGSEARFKGVAWATQGAIYNHGRPHPGPSGRDRWGRPLLDPEQAGTWPWEVRTDVAVILMVARGAARVEPMWVDTELGWRLATLSCYVRAARKRGPEVRLEAPTWLS